MVFIPEELKLQIFKDMLIQELLEDQKKMVFDCYSTIRNIKNPSEELKRIAVISNGNALQYLKNPSYSLQLLAVRSNGESILFVNEQTEELQFIAVKQNVKNLVYIQEPTEKVAEFCAENQPIVTLKSLRDQFLFADHFIKEVLLSVIVGLILKTIF